MNLSKVVPAQIGYSDSQGQTRTVAVAVEATDSITRLQEWLAGLRDVDAATRAGLEAGIGMTSILTVGDPSKLAVLRIGTGESLLGWLIGAREPGTLEIRLGPWRLFSARGDRLRLIGGYSLCPAAQANEADFLAAAARLIAELRTQCMVMMQTVSPQDPLARVADELRRRGVPRFEQQYDAQPRYGVRTAENFDAYLAQLNSKWRSTFRRSLRTFDSHFETQTEMRCFRSEEEVTAFIDDAEKVSRRTWQWHEAGRGMQNRTAVDARLRLAAKLGYFHSFVLYGRGEPLAFVEGFLAGGCYIPFQIGFVKEMASLSVGTVCQLLVLRCMHESTPPRARWVDYMDGDDDWKRSMANVKTVETSYRALPDGLQWAFAMALLRGMNLAVRFMRYLKKAPQQAVKAGAWILTTLPDDFGFITDVVSSVSVS